MLNGYFVSVLATKFVKVIPLYVTHITTLENGIIVFYGTSIV